MAIVLGMDKPSIKKNNTFSRCNVVLERITCMLIKITNEIMM